MKSAYRNAVSSRFHALFSEQFPHFVLRKGRDRDMPGSRLYVRVISDSLVLFVHLIIHDNADEFNIDMGHGPSDSPPIESFFIKPAEMLTMPASLFRLTEFWDERDPWWVVEPYRPVWSGTDLLPEQTYLPRVESLFAEAVARPYFDQVVIKHGAPQSFTAA